MADIFETSDSNINAHATGSFTIGFDDTFHGTFGDTDHQDGINLPVLEAGQSYTISMTVDDVADFHSIVIINPSNFHSAGFHWTDGVPHTTSPYSNGFVTVSNPTLDGNTLSIEVVVNTTKGYSLALQGINGPTENYTVTIAETDPYGITEESDDVTGTSSADIVDLLDGDDSFAGGDGNDEVQGSNGNDDIQGEIGDDLLNGGGHDDTLSGGTGNDTLLGGSGDDSLLGDDDDDVINGGNGADDIQGGAGEDSIIGGKDDDVIDGGSGLDTIEGGFGNDTMDGGDGADTFVVIANNGQDVINNFGNGPDVIDVSGLGISSVGQMTISDDGTDTTIDFGSGNSIVLTGILSADVDASDFVLAANPTTVTGTNGRDNLNGSSSADVMSGLNGRDVMHGLGGDDDMSGGGRNDRMYGGEGNDTMSGDNGNDKLFGDAGSDELAGGSGKDQLTGGADADTFVFAVGGNDDVITDFEDGVDVIDLSGLAAAGITGVGDLAITQVGADVHIALDAGSSVTLANTLLGDIDGADFIF